MRPEPLFLNYDNLIEVETEPGKTTNVKFEKLSDKEFLFRQVMLNQSIRSMMMFIVGMSIINILGFILIIGILLS